MKNFFEELVNTIKNAGSYNKNDQTAPAVILWTDKDRQWETLLPRLRELLPLLTFDLAEFTPADHKGPAYYLRCLLAGTIPANDLPLGIPIIYLPGVSKQEMRAVEECPKALQPLAELQYRGVFFTQKNGKDWTIAAFLQSGDGGLKIDVSADQATRDALKKALLKLSDVTVDELKKEAPVKAAYLFTLLNPDDIRSLLKWLDDPKGYPQRLSPEEWSAFCSVCKQKYQFSPEIDGPITAAEQLGNCYGAWKLVWDRYLEAPQAYPNIPEKLRIARPTQLTLFERAETWPQDNEAEENQLRQDLIGLENLTIQQARTRILDLEQHHGKRRHWVWARLNETPLANAIKYLAYMASSTNKTGNTISLDDIISGYVAQGWQVDNALLDAMGAVDNLEDIQAVKVAVHSIYYAWLEAGATAFQKAISEGSYKTFPIPLPDNGTCIIFSDGLRLDLANRLQDGLLSRGYKCSIAHHLAALPSITGTAKPSLLPVSSVLSGKGSDSLTPFISAKSVLTADSFRKLLVDQGFQILKDGDCGDPSGRGWTELGEIDAYGHEHSNKLPMHIPGELLSLEKRISLLLDFGWKQVYVVTDHGWLWVPGGMPKIILPEHLTVMRKGRCARLKDGAHVDFQSLPWYWDTDVWVTYAPGIGNFEAGTEYEHGGLSPQECITPVLTIQKPVSESGAQAHIHGLSWKGLRCSIEVDGVAGETMVDLRSKAGDPGSSVAVAPKALDIEGRASLVVEDDDRIGEAVFVVVLTSGGQIAAQMHTTIGG